MLKIKSPKIMFFLLLISCSLHADEWTHWRGPHYNGSFGRKNIPIALADKESVKWHTPLPGNGSSSPITSGNSIFLTCEMPVTRELVAVCIDRTTGKTRWMRLGGQGRKIPESNMATPSAVTDGTKVFFMFGNGEFVAFDFKGKELWRRNIEKEYGKLTTRFGYSASPLLYQGRLYVIVLRLDRINIEPTPEKPGAASYFMAVDPNTGTNLWKHVRLCDGREESQEAYTSPIPYEYGDRREILILGGDCLTGHDPETGKELWRWKGYNPKRITVGRVITSPVVADDLVIICGPRHKDVFAVRPNGRGSLDEKALVWKIDGRGSDSITPLFHNGVLYLMNGQYSTIKAVNPKDGTILWNQQLETGVAMKASPIGIGNRIYNINEKGEVLAMQAGNSFALLEKKSFGGKLCRASITAIDEDILIRTSNQIYCLGTSR